MLRSIMYAWNGTQLHILMDEYPETRLLVPVVSGLCLLSIILSALILKKLVENKVLAVEGGGRSTRYRLNPNAENLK